MSVKKILTSNFTVTDGADNRTSSNRERTDQVCEERKGGGGGGEGGRRRRVEV